MSSSVLATDVYSGVGNWNVINKYDLATGAYVGPAISNLTFTDFELGNDGFVYAGVSNWNVINKYDLATGAYVGPAISNLTFTDFEMGSFSVPEPTSISIFSLGLALLLGTARKNILRNSAVTGQPAAWSEVRRTHCKTYNPRLTNIWKTSLCHLPRG